MRTARYFSIIQLSNSRHVEWHMKGVKIRLKEAVLSEQFQWIDKKDLENTYALPSAFEIFRKVL